METIVRCPDPKCGHVNKTTKSSGALKCVACKLFAPIAAFLRGETNPRAWTISGDVD